MKKRWLLFLLAALSCAEPAWAAAGVWDGPLDQNGVHYITAGSSRTFTWDAATTGDQLAIEAKACSVFSVTSEVTGTGSVSGYQVPTAATATSSGTFAFTVSATTRAPVYVDVGPYFLRLAVDDGAAGSLTVRCTGFASLWTRLTGLFASVSNAVLCTITTLDPADCASRTEVATQPEAIACMALASDGICYGTRQMIVTDPPGTSAFPFVLDATAARDRRFVCKDASASLVLNLTSANASKNIVEFHTFFDSSPSTVGSRTGLEGCTVYQTVNGVPGGGTGVVEGVVQKPTGETTTVRHRFVMRNNRISVYSTGSSTIGMGTNPASMTDSVYEGNKVFAAIGADFKQDCDGCDTVGILAINNDLFANPSGSNPRAFKSDGDAAIKFIGNRFIGLLSMSGTATEDIGWIEFVRGTGNVILDTLTGSSAMDVPGASYTAKVRGEIIVQEARPTAQFFLGVAGLWADLDIRMMTCPTSFTEYFDVEGVDAPDTMPFVRMVWYLPEGCTLPTIAQMVSSRSDDEFDDHSTKGLVKVGRGTATGGATLAVLQGDAGGANTAPRDYDLVDDAPNSAEVDCDTGLVISAANFDLGDEAAGYCNKSCTTEFVAGAAQLCTNDVADATVYQVMMR